jgi:hypothetical protein
VRTLTQIDRGRSKAGGAGVRETDKFEIPNDAFTCSLALNVTFFPSPSFSLFFIRSCLHLAFPVLYTTAFPFTIPPLDLLRLRRVQDFHTQHRVLYQ